MLLASVSSKIEELLLPVLIQLVVIIIAARLGAIVFRWMKQPAVVGEIAAGLILGKSFFGRFFPDLSKAVFAEEVNDVFGIMSQIGLILLLFLIGLEFDFSHLRKLGKAAVSISLTGILLPFSLGLGLAWLTYDFIHRPEEKGESVELLGYALFMGTAMSITAIPILGRMMMELGVTRTKVGAVTITSAAVDDAVGWIILATISSIVQAKYNVNNTLKMLGLTVLFFLFMVFIARPLLKKLAQSAVQGPKGEISLNHFAALLVVLLLCSITTNLIGIFAIFGAFLLGTMLSDEEAFREAAAKQIRNFVTVFFLPIFFTYTGLRTDIGTLREVNHLWMLGGVLFCAIFGKLAGCGIAARLGGFSPRDSVIIGTLMNTRALMELIVINVGRELGVITPSVFCMLVIMALVTTVMTTPLLLWFRKGSEFEKPIEASGFLGAAEVPSKVRPSHARSRH